MIASGSKGLKETRLSLRGHARSVLLKILPSYSGSCEITPMIQVYVTVHHHHHHHVLYFMLAERSKTICSNRKTSEDKKEEKRTN